MKRYRRRWAPLTGPPVKTSPYDTPAICMSRIMNLINRRDRTDLNDRIANTSETHHRRHDFYTNSAFFSLVTQSPTSDEPVVCRANGVPWLLTPKEKNFCCIRVLFPVYVTKY